MSRLSVPTPMLSLYCDEQHQLWSNKVIITHHSDTAKAGLNIPKETPLHAKGKTTMVSAARQEHDGLHLVRSIKNLLA